MVRPKKSDAGNKNKPAPPVNEGIASIDSHTRQDQEIPTPGSDSSQGEV